MQVFEMFSQSHEEPLTVFATDLRHAEGIYFEWVEAHRPQWPTEAIAAYPYYEADIRRERQREGVDRAKAAGVYKGRKAVVDAAQVRSLRDQGLGGTEIAKKLGVARATVYRALSR